MTEMTAALYTLTSTTAAKVAVQQLLMWLYRNCHRGCTKLPMWLYTVCKVYDVVHHDQSNNCLLWLYRSSTATVTELHAGVVMRPIMAGLALPSLSYQAYGGGIYCIHIFATDPQARECNVTCAHKDLVEARVPVHSHCTAHCANAAHQLQPASSLPYWHAAGCEVIYGDNTTFV